MTVTHIAISAKVVDVFAKAVPWAKAVKKTVSTLRGPRIYPSQTPKNDSSKNSRLDKGSEVDGKHELILQANMNEEDKVVKEAAAKDSHATFAKILVDSNDGLIAIQDLIATLKNAKSSIEKPHVYWALDN